MINLTYQDTKTYRIKKYYKKSVSNYHLHKVIYPISRLQDKSSEAIGNIINHNSGSMYLSNITETSETLPSSTIYIISANSKSMNNQQGSMLFFCDNNAQKMIYSNDTFLTVPIEDNIISEVISFNLAQKPRLHKVLDLKKNIR